MNVANSNAWRFFNNASGNKSTEAVGISASGSPVEPLRTHLLAGTLLGDANQNGVKDAGKGSLSGVTLTLGIDANSDVRYQRSRTTTTESLGRYTFTNWAE